MNKYKVNEIEELIEGNPYVGRGIVIGKSQDGTKAVLAYFIMGRSANSRNRILAVRDNAVYTEPFDASKVEDPSLIIYPALKQYKNHIIVTNGDQTDTIYEGLKNGVDFINSLNSRTFEPDAPNFTPRISGMITFKNGDFSYMMSILKSIDEKGSDCARYSFSYPSMSGLGHFLHTYMTDGNPIPTFEGEPRRIKIGNDIDVFSNTLWNALDTDNKIALYVRYIDISSGNYDERIINKN